jgi:plasmid maintenance system antidote protein VapI
MADIVAIELPPARPAPAALKHPWILRRLLQRGYLQADLARAWGIPQASVTRFLQGVEGQDITLRKARILAAMLGMKLEDFATLYEVLS